MSSAMCLVSTVVRHCQGVMVVTFWVKEESPRDGKSHASCSRRIPEPPDNASCFLMNNRKSHVRSQFPPGDFRRPGRSSRPGKCGALRSVTRGPSASQHAHDDERTKRLSSTPAVTGQGRKALISVPTYMSAQIDGFVSQRDLCQLQVDPRVKRDVVVSVFCQIPTAGGVVDE